jgi:hypothetical protein
MAKSKDKVKKYLPVRYGRRRTNGYWSRQRLRTNKNILKRLDKHIADHPNDEIAKLAKRKRLIN